MSNPFRLVENRPSRRNIVKSVAKYQDHKDDLKIDFKSRCGYCDAHDAWRHTYYEIDHFVPKFVFVKGKKIKETDYSNLVYACRYCNNAKRSIWPTNDENLHNDGASGYIEPWLEDYEKQFHRDKDGRILGVTDLGKWMYRVFKFSRREPQIELVWKLEKLFLLLKKLRKEQDKFDKKSNEYSEIQSKLGQFALMYFDFDQQLKEFNG